MVDGVERPESAAVEGPVQPVLAEVRGDQQDNDLKPQGPPRQPAVAAADLRVRRLGVAASEKTSGQSHGRRDKARVEHASRAIDEIGRHRPGGEDRLGRIAGPEAAKASEYDSAAADQDHRRQDHRKRHACSHPDRRAEPIMHARRGPRTRMKAAAEDIPEPSARAIPPGPRDGARLG